MQTVEERSADIYHDTYSAVVRALKPFDIPPLSVERVATEAAEMAVASEMDWENE
jgi:hypothetical protein